MNKKSQKLALGGVMIALATILSLITIYSLPYGGSITLLSMLPLLFVGFIYGKAWGVLTGVIYGILQAILGAATSSAFAGLDFVSVMLVIILDYLVAFGVLGFAGIFKNKIKNIPLSFGLGVFLSTTLRYITHFISGYIVYGSYAEWFFSQETVSYGEKIMSEYSGKMLAAVYSLIYNATFMIPEIILSVIAGILIVNIPGIKEICKRGSL
ncbi:MAG: energy-coupled thiamine transporter ThiT [Clostridia bacterium]|nr:energy-coupled thiamine transporter ThiT [Clostridia bacterium]